MKTHYFYLYLTALVLCTQWSSGAQTLDKLLQEAAENNTQSMTELAEAYLKGLYGLEQNSTEALRLYTEAASSGHAEAQYLAGLFHLRGWGTIKNPQQGVEWLKQSADNGYNKAAVDLGRMYEKGRFVDQDKEEAIRWYLLAARNGSALSQRIVGQSYLLGAGVEKNIQTSLNWFRKSALGGNALAMYYLGFMYKKGLGIQKNYVKAVEWFKKGGLELNNDQAKYALGYMHYKGFGTDQDYEKAAKLFKQSANRGNKNAQYMLGVCHLRGQGVEKSIDKALHLYRKSAEGKNGNKQAARVLKRLEKDSGARTLIAYSKGETTADQFTPEKYVPIAANNGFSQVGLSGRWTGRLIMYDWAGQEIENSTPVDVDLSTVNNEIKGWLQLNGEVSISLRAMRSGNTLAFTDTAIIRQDLWYYPQPMNWQVKEGTFVSNLVDGKQILTIDLSLYSPREAEEYNPTVLVLEKASEDRPFSPGMVYPNPFVSDINVNYNLEQAGPTTIEVYNLQGAKVMSLRKAEEVAGPKWHTFSPELKKGIYFLKVFSTNELLVNKKIIKY